MKKKMEDVARELGEEREKLFTFVKQRFIESVEGLGKPKPEFKEYDTKIVFILKQKAFVKTLEESERKDGKIGYGHKELREVPHSELGGITLIFKHPTNEKKKVVHILLNCARIRRQAVKFKIDLKELTTLTLIHEMIHNLEILTGIFILRAPSLKHDGFTLPIYEAWCERKKRENRKRTE